MRWWDAPPDRLRVLAYHDVQDQDGFAWQLAYLQRNYNVIALDQLRAFLTDRTPLPPKAVLLTFDDAWPGIYDNALELLRVRKLPAVVFVISSLVGTSSPYWWDEIPYYLPDDWSEAEKNAKVWEVKTWADQKRLAYLQKLNTASTKPPLVARQLSWSELAEMEAGGIAIGNHTHTHPMLDQCSAAKVEMEITTTQQLLTERKAKAADAFAYPNGNASVVAEAVLRESGCRMAFLFDHRVNGPLMQPLRISRLSVNPDLPRAQFKCILSGLHSRLLRLRKKWA